MGALQSNFVMQITALALVKILEAMVSAFKEIA